MKNSLGYRIFGQIFFLTAVFMCLYPIAQMIVESLRRDGIANYAVVFERVNLLPNFMTSLYVVGGTLILVSIVTSLAAFSFSKLQFPAKNQIYYLLLAGMMIPTSAIIFPLFQIVKGLSLNNTPLALIFPYVTLNSIFNLMVLRNFYDGLPNEMIEAAQIDGANYSRIFLTIMLPLSLPGLSIVLIQTFLSAWNELQMAMTFINNPNLQPLSVVPMRFIQEGVSAQYSIAVRYACLVVCLCPILVFYVAAQRLLIEGITQGAVKG